jgi:hypothetical protein
MARRTPKAVAAATALQNSYAECGNVGEQCPEFRDHSGHFD